MKNIAFLTLFSIPLWPTAASADQIFLDDVIVNGSTCVGMDCVNGESFQFNTIVLKENNLRIRFFDTSTSAGFPTTDWRLVANDSALGGDEHFSIDNATTDKTPFRVAADAGNFALYVSAAGAGLGTDEPQRALHVTAGDTPTLRLEQTTDLGWPNQKWEVGGNESTFFIRDETGTASPFRILPGAGDDTLVINPAGVRVTDSGPVTLAFEDTAAAATWRQTHSSASWELTSPTATVLTVLGDGNATLLGMLTQGSSRQIKKDIESVDTSEILAKVEALDINHWRYKSDATGARHLGPMAEEFHAAFGLGADDAHIAPADMAAVAVASAQALVEQNDDQAVAIDRLERENAALKRRLERLEALIHDR